VIPRKRRVLRSAARAAIAQSNLSADRERITTLIQIARLRADGVLTEAEYLAEKARLIKP
jgi:hypothetical protein